MWISYHLQTILLLHYRQAFQAVFHHLYQQVFLQAFQHVNQLIVICFFLHLFHFHFFLLLPRYFLCLLLCFNHQYSLPHYLYQSIYPSPLQLDHRQSQNHPTFQALIQQQFLRSCLFSLLLVLLLHILQAFHPELLVLFQQLHLLQYLQ
jgi:hypothetical protein